ncbi:MAG: fructose-1,6-bisphosphatase [Salinivirgaceae bacterium]|jgi:fructose-1,6-bisphosphatase-3|nr:fructose-1,6-bisphosphatase [Salinivirgaceae bacterium]
MKLTKEEIEYYKLLARSYPTIQAASTEIINLSAILNLPKGTEHFMSDIHGEYESFIHIVNNASGVVKRKINDVFGETITQKDKAELATLIFYPREKLKIIKHDHEDDLADWYKVTLFRLVEVCRNASTKYTRSKVRKALPKDFAYVIEELLHEQENAPNKQEYYNGIIDTIIRIQRADNFIAAISNLIRRLVIDHLHIVGDIFDRGPEPDRVINKLQSFIGVDIQWGNHDILWMGAAMGCQGCISNVLRISARYDNLSIIEENYGINLMPLASFAMEAYEKDDCQVFAPKAGTSPDETKHQQQLIRQMHKAISVIQFKIEGAIIERNPWYQMQDRLILNNIDYTQGTITIDGKTYELKDKNFPTINPKNPYNMTKSESKLMAKLQQSFVNSEKLQKHLHYLFEVGSMYLIFNKNLLLHGCIPMTKDGEFMSMKIFDKDYSGKALNEKLDKIVRKAFGNHQKNTPNSYELDFLWYLWSGPVSPLYGKQKMATFERYLIADKTPHHEEKNPYFDLRDNEEVCRKILADFGIDPDEGHIVNGHTPVKRKTGESPVKGNGKLIVIDGGLAKPYQSITGIAGYTLIYNSYGLILAAHRPFESTRKAIVENADISTSQQILERNNVRKRVGDTDVGIDLKDQIFNLERLLVAYRDGIIKEQPKRQ